MDHRPLDHALEASRRLRLLAAGADEVLQLGVDVIGEIGPELLEIDIAGAHQCGGILIVDQREQQVLESRVFVPALIGERQRTVQSLVEVARERGQFRLRNRLLLFHDALQRVLVLAREISSPASPWSRRSHRCRRHTLAQTRTT